MKKVSLMLVIAFFSIAFRGFSQTTSPTDFFAGKWEVSTTGTPRGDVKFLTDLVRKDGKLTGELVDSADPKEKRAITRIEENANKLVIYFESSQAGEVSIDLTKVDDDDNLKGTLMSYDATAKRLK